MATAAYEAVAATRPRIRRDVLFTETPDGVLFHNADGGFQLTAKSAYRFATLIVPHLNGQHAVSEISEGFGERQRAMLGELVRTLYARGFARDVPEPDGKPGDEGFPSPDAARRFAPQIAYIDHYTDAAERAFARFRQTRVAVLGEDDVARWCVLSLIRNGSAAIGVLPGLERADIDAEAAEAAADECPVDMPALRLPGGETQGAWRELASYDVVLVTGGPGAAQHLFPLLREGIPKGVAVIPAWSYGEHAVMGPLMAHGRGGCWSCALLRLGSGGSKGSVAAAADVWSSLALPGAAPAGGRPDGPLAAMIGNMLGYEVFRFTTGALRAETDGQLIVQDMASLDVTSEPLLPHPRCTLCTQA
ncbi:TOMM precursor leader peptide-binding protein, partial [Streptomyces albidus (ex Kaewkla and Franco 2022)]|uniref:TOMM precursor leader peptide-binding protein n=1 Tax=Streptomyces albidus (ex Kaewkla and Franco 2022) TaxID=722709 RepID=UPI0015EED590